MKIVFLIFLFFVADLLCAQDDITIENGENYKPGSVAPFIRDLYAANDYVISFRLNLKDTIDERSDYFVLARKADKLSAYNYSITTSSLRPLDLPLESLTLAWKTFIQNDLFTMRNEKDIPNFCLEKYQIYNSYTYEFVLLSRGRVKKLSYYDPEYYDNACYGMTERKKIINSVSVINYVLNH